MSDYVPGRYTGFKNAVYWMTTKRRNWLGLALVLFYWLAAAVAVVVSLNDRGAQSALPWAIGLGAFALMIVVAGGLLAFALYWKFPLFPDPGTSQKPDPTATTNLP